MWFTSKKKMENKGFLFVKLKKQKTREVLLDLVVLQQNAGVFVTQRAADHKRLAGFWELPDKTTLPGLEGKLSAEFTHQIVNDRIRVRIYLAPVPKNLPPGRWVSAAEFPAIPVSTITRKALEAVSRLPARRKPVPSPLRP